MTLKDNHQWQKIKQGGCIAYCPDPTFPIFFMNALTSDIFWLFLRIVYSIAPIAWRVTKDIRPAYSVEIEFAAVSSLLSSSIVAAKASSKWSSASLILSVIEIVRLIICFNEKRNVQRHL